MARKIDESLTFIRGIYQPLGNSADARLRGSPPAFPSKLGTSRLLSSRLPSNENALGDAPKE